MTIFNDFQVDPPKSWDKFQSLCRDLWSIIWNDSNTMENGRVGQPQHGVDVFGRISESNNWGGVQCKKKDKLSGSKLTIDELRSEVDKAKKFEPKLSEFIIATTGSRDSKIQEEARIITTNQKEHGLFSVTVWTWEDIQNTIAEYPDIIEKYYPHYSNTTIGINKSVDEVRKIVEGIDNKLSKSDRFNSVTFSGRPLPVLQDTLSQEFHRDLEYAKSLIDSYNPDQCLDYLSKFKERVWSFSENNIKYKIFSYKGAAHLQIGEDDKAAKIYIKALQYNPEDENALSNAALGYYFLKEYDKMKELIDKLKSKNPLNYNIYSLSVNVQSTDKELEDILDNIPDSLSENPNILLAIGMWLYRKGDYKGAEEWIEKTIQIDKSKNPDLKGSLGDVIIRRHVENPINAFSNIQSPDIIDKVNRGIRYLTEAIKQIQHTDLMKHRLSWLINRSIAKSSLGDLTGAKEDLETVVSIEPSNPQYKKQLASILVQIDEDERAEKLLKGILDDESVPEVHILLADLYRKTNKYDDAINLLQEFLIDKDYKNELIRNSQSLLVQVYLDKRNYDNALAVSRKMRESEPQSLFPLIIVSRVERVMGNIENAKQLLSEAIIYSRNDSNKFNLIHLADELYACGLYEDASNVYVSVVDIERNDYLTKRLIHSYYQSGQIDKALDLCHNIRKRHGNLNYIVEMLSAIYQEIGDLKESISLLTQYLNENQNDYGIRIRLANVYRQKGDVLSLKNELSKIYDYTQLSIDLALLYISLLTHIKEYSRAINILYELRRKHYHNPKVHMSYLLFCFFTEGKLEEMENPSGVTINTVIYISNDSGEEEYFIIEEREDPDFSKREIASSNKIAKELNGKKVGDSVDITFNELQPRLSIIKSITSKYSHALKDSLDIYERLFPDRSDFKSFVINRTDDGKESFKEIFKKTLPNHEWLNEVMQYYKEGRLTIGAFSNIIQKDIPDLLTSLSMEKDIGIVCSSGINEEYNYAKSITKKADAIVIDAVSLFTLFGLNCYEILFDRLYDRVIVSQSTIDLMNIHVELNTPFIDKGYKSILYKDDQIYRHEISSENMKNYLERVSNYIERVKNACEILPVTIALSMRKEEKEQYDDMLSKDSIDSILLAKQENALIYSDDLRLRQFAKNEFNVNGTWCIPILDKMHKDGIINMNSFNELILKLITLNYHHIPINSEILIEASKKSKWSNKPPLSHAFYNLSGFRSSDNSAIWVAIDYIYKLWQQPILPMVREQLLFSLLESLTYGRNRKRIIDKFITGIVKRFSLLPVAEYQIMSLIDYWKKIRIL